MTAVPIYYDYRQVLASPLDLAVWIKQTLDVLELGPLVEGPEWERQLHELRLTAVWPDYILDFDRPEVNGPLWRKEALTTLVKAAPHRSPSIIRGASSMPSPSRVSPKVAGTAPLLSVRFQVTIVRSDNNEAESGASAPRRLAGTRFPLRDNPKSRSWLHPPIQVLMARRTTVANREHLTPLTGQSSAAVDVGAPRRATGVRDSEARLQALLSSLDDLVFELDEDGTYLGIWTGDDTLLAAPRSELLGRTVRELLGDEVGLRLTSIIGHVLETGCSETYEYSLKVPAGTRWFQGRITPIAASQSLPRSACLLVRDITLQKLAELARDRAEAQLRHQALYDGLTGVANRLALMDRLSQALAALDRNHGRVGLFFVDLDNFKAINDSFGHDAGDAVLAEVGRRLSRISRRSDTVARVGGDEFVLLHSNLRAEADARLIASRAVRAIGERFVWEGADLTVTASIGAVVTADPLARPGVLLRQADIALYEAKGAGRACFRIFDADRHAGVATNHNFDFDLRRAITDNELFLLYQPLFALGARSLRGVEALVRWRHPERGVVLPGDFIPMAETCGLIGAIDTFVLDEACRQLAQWTGEGGYPADFIVSVNVSGQQLSDLTLVDRIASTINKHRIVPSQLCLEITETAIIGELGDAATTLAALSELGVLLALDDFGTGYSTLAHLQRLNVNVLKIDRSFVEQITGNDRGRKIINAIIAMAHALGMSVVGEGIETDRQLGELTALGCDEGQGFFLARPVPPDQVASFSRGTGDAARHSAVAATAALNAGYRSPEFYLEHHKDLRAHSGAVA